MASRRLWEAMLVLLFLLGDAILLFNLSRLQNFGLDFGPLWVGARLAVMEPSLQYDFAHVTAAQDWLTAIPGQTFGQRPFIYPPSALPVLVPFGLMPFAWAYGLWAALTGSLFVWAARRIGAPWWVATFPPVVFVAAIGQVVFMTGGLVVLALHFRDRERLSGMLFGIAGAVKPQLLIFVPVALAADRRWIAFATAGVTWLAILAVSLIWLGPAVWLEWIRALGAFHEVVFGNPEMLRHAVSPYAQLERFGLPGPWAYLLILPMTWLVWLTFRRTGAFAPRLIVLVGAALMCTPYGMEYELAALAPALALMVREAKGHWLPVIASGAIVYGVAFPLGLPLLVGVLALAWLQLFGIRRGAGAQQTA